MYYTDKICSQPLTPALHLSDLRSAVPGYTELVARALKATVLTVGRLRGVYKENGDKEVAGATRDSEIRDGIPYMLRKRCELWDGRADEEVCLASPEIQNVCEVSPEDVFLGGR
jgi:hypothetical protein